MIGTAPDSVAAIKAAVFRHNGSAGVLGVLDRPPFGPAELAVRIKRGICLLADRTLVTAQFAAPRAWQAANTGTGELPHRAFGQLSLVWRVTSGMLDRIGEKDLPWLAVEEGMTTVDHSGDDLLIAGDFWWLAGVLRHSGRL